MTLPEGMARPRAVLFDWDNTLVNTWPTIVECYNNTFTALGLPLWTTQEVKDRAHGSLRDHFPKLFGERAGEAEKVFYETFSRIHLERLEPLPGAADLTRVAGIEEQQVPGQRHHLQRVLARAGGKQQFALGA